MGALIQLILAGGLLYIAVTALNQRKLEREADWATIQWARQEAEFWLHVAMAAMAMDKRKASGEVAQARRAYMALLRREPIVRRSFRGGYDVFRHAPVLLREERLKSMAEELERLEQEVLSAH